MMILLLLSLVAADPQPVPVSTPKKPAASPDKKICQSFVETGSLISSHKVCKTKREWERERENLRTAGPGVDSCRNSGTGGPC